MRRPWRLAWFAMLLCSAALLWVPRGTAGVSAPAVDLIAIDGSINPAVAEYLEDALGQATRDSAAALLIELDTPGGLLNSAQRIVKDLLSARIPVIVYVTPAGASAASAGMFITEAASVAAMAPGTTIGAAHPVTEGGGEPEGKVGQKIENFTAALARAIAEQRGRNQQWVEDAVRNSADIGAKQALAEHVIDIVAADRADLLRQANGMHVKLGGKDRVLALDGAVVRERTMTWGQRVLATLADPNLVYLLLMGGIVGLYFEFAHPGVYLPGVLGAICLLLAFASFQLLPINVSGVLLLLFGVALLGSEAFFTSHGILGIIGLIAFVLGSLFMIDTSKTNVVVSRPMIAGVAVGLSAILIGLGLLITRDRWARALTGREGLIGEVGEVRERIAPGTPGRVFVHGETWTAMADEALDAGSHARVAAVTGIRLKVEKAG